MSFTRSLDEARAQGCTHLTIEMDWGGIPVLTCPLDQVACDESKLKELIQTLCDYLHWDGEDCFFSGSGVLPEESNHLARQFVVDSDVKDLGIETAIKQYLAGEIASLPEGTLEVHHRSELTGRSPLHDAVESGWVELARALIQSGADLEARDQFQRTPFHQLCFESHCGDRGMEMVDLLVNAGCNLSPLDHEGCSPLFIGKRGGGADDNILLYAKSKGAQYIPFEEPPLDLPDRVEGRAISNARLVDTIQFSFDYVGKHPSQPGKSLLIDRRNGQYWVTHIESFPEEEHVFVATKLDAATAKAEFGRLDDPTT